MPLRMRCSARNWNDNVTSRVIPAICAHLCTNVIKLDERSSAHPLPYYRHMGFRRWLNKPITYIYVVFATIVFIGTINMEPSRFDPRSEPTSPDPGGILLILIVGFFLVRSAWSVIKIIFGSFAAAMEQRPERHGGKPFSFWDY